MSSLLENTFEPVVGRKFLAIPLLLEDLRAMGLPCRMSGSGSCCFALPEDSGPSVEAIRARVQDAWGDAVFFVETSILGTKTK